MLSIAKQKVRVLRTFHEARGVGVGWGVVCAYFGLEIREGFPEEVLFKLSGEAGAGGG